MMTWKKKLIASKRFNKFIKKAEIIQKEKNKESKKPTLVKAKKKKKNNAFIKMCSVWH